MNDLKNNSHEKTTGILIFDLNCHLMYSNHDGRLLYGGVSEPVTPSLENRISFEVNRLCFRLKKVADSQLGEAAVFEKSRLTIFSTTSGNIGHRIHGSLIADEMTKKPCVFIQIEVEKQQGGTAKLNLAYYQSTYRLTRREIQILELLSKGASYKEIGYTLTISAHTVRDHIKNIRFKLHAEGKCGILARLIEDGVVSDETNLSCEADSTHDEGPWPHLGSAELKVPVPKTICAEVEKAVLPMVAHAQSAPKLREDVTTRVGRASNLKANCTMKAASTEPWRLTSKRDIQQHRKSL